MTENNTFSSLKSDTCFTLNLGTRLATRLIARKLQRKWDSHSMRQARVSLHPRFCRGLSSMELNSFRVGYSLGRPYNNIISVLSFQA